MDATTATTATSTLIHSNDTDAATPNAAVGGPVPVESPTGQPSAGQPLPAKKPTTNGQVMTIKVASSLQRLLVEKALLMAQELEAAGAAARWGHALDDLEEAAVKAGRDLTAAALQEAAQQHIDAQEKKLRSGVAPAGPCDSPKGRTRGAGSRRRDASA